MDLSRPLSFFQLLFKANLIFKDFSRQSCILKNFSSLCEPCIYSQIWSIQSPGDYRFYFEFSVVPMIIFSFSLPTLRFLYVKGTSNEEVSFKTEIICFHRLLLK